MPGVARSLQRCVKEQLCKATDADAKVKNSLQYGGVSRMLGMDPASLAVAGITGLYGVQRWSAQLSVILLLRSRKRAPLVTEGLLRIPVRKE